MKQQDNIDNFLVVEQALFQDLDYSVMRHRSCKKAATEQLHRGLSLEHDPLRRLLVLLGIAKWLLEVEVMQHEAYLELERCYQAFRENVGNALSGHIEDAILLIRDKQEIYELVARNQAKYRNLLIGSIIQLPLTVSNFAYGQYVMLHEQLGPILRVFRRTFAYPVGLSELDTSSDLVPPIICGIKAGVADGIWQIMGRAEIGMFQVPYFRSAMRGKSGEVLEWSVTNGVESICFGAELPDRFKELEQNQVYPPGLVNKKLRIALGLS